MEKHQYVYKTQPFKHQREHFEQHADREGWALLWEMGTGKSKPTIDTVSYLYESGKINGLLVVAPPGVERNWATDELPAHMPARVLGGANVFVYKSGKISTKAEQKRFETLLTHDGLSVVLISYPAFYTTNGRKLMAKFLRARRCMYVLDEAHNIKTPAAKRTQSILKSAAFAPYRRILTGTPVSVGPFDLYAQLKFVDGDFWKRKGLSSFTEYKNFFANMASRPGADRDPIRHMSMADLEGHNKYRKKCIEELGYDPKYAIVESYKNLDILQKWLSETSDRQLKDEVLDLPPKLYVRRYVEMSPVQRKVYDQLRDEMMYQFEDGETVSADLPIVNMLRLQQVLCGYVPTDDGSEPIRMLEEKNPRLQALEDLCEELHSPTIIWARFRMDVDQIMELLGDQAVRYDGAISDDEAERSKQRFQAGEVKYFVGTAQKGGPGLTLHRAKNVVYFSNDFNYITRMQSEDRAHRAGMDNKPVTYYDLIVPDTIDEKVRHNLLNKQSIAADITGDKLKEWIR